MRKMLFLLGLAALAACNSGKDTKVDSMSNKDSSGSANDNITYPYTADYSSSFEMGDPKNALTLLKLYKDWDNNTMNNSKEYFADQDTMVFSNGYMFTGSRDSLIAMASQERGKMGNVVDSVHAWIPLRSKDKNEDWVLIWSKEITTDANGKKTSKEIQETWRFDKNGKINLVYQYEQQPPKMPPPPPTKK